MAAETILSVDRVSKRYATRLRPALKYGMVEIARACLGRDPRATLHPDEFWALRDVSFTLGRGEAIALLGANGSGKSTLLKIAYGILKPDSGEVRRRGEIAGLLELGAGLDGRLSGHENIALRAAMHHRDISARRATAQGAAEFSELGSDLDKPVQTYSSGMKARLAFAMAASARADLLLVDEALAVGDAAFRHKCISFLHAHLAGGGALLLTSHQPGPIETLCKRALVLRNGAATEFGDIHQALSAMLALPAAATNGSSAGAQNGMPVTIENVSIGGENGSAPRTHGMMEIRVRCRAAESMKVTWAFGVWTPDRSAFICGGFEGDGAMLPTGESEVVCRVPDLPLLPGEYCAGILISDPRLAHAICSVGWTGDGIPFTVPTEESPTAIANAKRAYRQLVDIKVEWGEAAP